MAQSLGFGGRVEPAAAPRAVATRHYRAGERSPSWDLTLARRTKANVVVIGPQPITSDIVISLWRHFDGPIIVQRRDDRLRLSPTSEPIGTIVLYGLETLTPREQDSLYHWLEACRGRTRVVSTAATSILSKIEAGTFSDNLYYLLNTVCLDFSVPLGGTQAEDASSSKVE